MMRNTQTLALVGTGISAGLVWRLELEAHGWEGLDWIGYFHWAIPAGMTLFLGWLLVFAPITSRVKRAALVLATAVAGIVWFQVVQFALVYHFNGGPSAFVNFLAVGEKSYRFYANLIYVVAPLSPLLFAGLLCAFGLRPRALRIVVAVMAYMLACPASMVLLAVIQHRGGADALHTIKSGFIVPFLVVGLGLLVPPKGDGRPPAASCFEP